MSLTRDRLTMSRRFSGATLGSRLLLSMCAIAATSCSQTPRELWVGVYESESRANFGSDPPGRYRIDVVAASEGRYVATIHRNGEVLGKRELVPCPVDREQYFDRLAPGRAEVLCGMERYGTPHGFIGYSENGLDVPAVRAKYAKNPELIAREGLQPGDPRIFELRHYDTQYYAHVSWFFYGFRKVEP